MIDQIGQGEKLIKLYGLYRKMKVLFSFASVSNYQAPSVVSIDHLPPKHWPLIMALHNPHCWCGPIILQTHARLPKLLVNWLNWRQTNTPFTIKPVANNRLYLLFLPRCHGARYKLVLSSTRLKDVVGQNDTIAISPAFCCSRFSPL